MIVLDASVLIAHLNGADAHHSRADILLTRKIDEDFAVSAMTLAEAYVTPTREGRLEVVRRALDNLGIAELPLPAAAAVMLARLRHESRLKLPDCCVLLAAQQHQAQVASFDTRLVLAARALGLDVIDA